MLCNRWRQVGSSRVGGLASAVSGHSTETNDKWGVGVRVSCLQSVVSPLCQFNGGCNSGGGVRNLRIFFYIYQGEVRVC